MDIKQIRLRNLRSLISESGTIANLARLSETAPAYLSQILNSLPTSTGKPRSVGDKLARKLEQALTRPYGWMDKDHEGSDNTKYQDIPQVALLTTEQVLRHLSRPSTNNNKTVPIPIVSSHLAFAMQVWDDSMTPKFQKDDIIVVDPEIAPTADDYVLAIQSEKPQELVFRHLVDTNGRHLEAMNPSYGTHLVTSNDKIVGKVIYRGEIF